MPDTQLTNPNAEESEQWSTSQVIEEYLYDPTATSTTPIVNGDVVVMYGGYTPSLGTTSTTVVSTSAIPVVRRATTTPGAITVGVAINAPTGGYLPGSVVQVVVKGVASPSATPTTRRSVSTLFRVAPLPVLPLPRVRLPPTKPSACASLPLPSLVVLHSFPAT